MVTWTVRTTDAAGRPVPAQVSLALVDKAILTLADDPAGTLMNRFYAERALGVRTATTLVVNVDRLVAQLSAGGKGGGGGGGGGGGIDLRTEFPDIAFWQAKVATNAGGEAQVAVKLPDNLTTWSMDARAVTANTLVGQSKTEIIATKDLLIRPVLPRFFIEGDQAELAAVIHNNTANALDVAIDLSATGLQLPAQTQSRVNVAAGGTYKATWPVSVKPNQDQAGQGSGEQQVTVQMTARSTALSDGVEMTIPVHRYSTPEVTGTSGTVAQDESRLELVRLPEGSDPTRGELAVTIEPSLAAGMTGGLTLPRALPLRVRRADDEPLPAERYQLPGAQKVGALEPGPRDKAAADGWGRSAADLRPPARRRGLGLVAARPERCRRIGLRALRPVTGKTGRLRGRCWRDEPGRALPQGHAKGARPI